jgi:nucleoid-associated protein YgaU
MKKNTAGLVALGVLVIATLLMIFVVLPNVGDKAVSPVAGSATPAAPAADGAPGTPGALSSGAPVVADEPPAAPQTAADAKGNRPVAAPPSGSAAAPSPAPVPASPSSPTVASAPAAPKAAGDTAAPSFDVLRVEPDGSTVIAGGAAPNSKIEILNGDTVIATAQAGDTGDFAAILDKPLSPGDYQLTLRSTAPGGAATTSEEVATVSIPKVANGELLAMVTKPGEASRIMTAPGDTAAASAAGAPAAAPAQTPAASAVPAPAGDQSAAAQPPVQTPPSAAASANPASTVSSAGSPVSVSAVEIEGSKLFVAGTARPGSTVRVYADDKLVGEAKVDAQGRFVVDGEIALAVGQHVIRVDLIGEDGKVQLRAAVPFERPAGEQVSVVAQTPESRAEQAFDGAIFDASRTEAGKAFALLKRLFADGKLPGLDQLAAARSATEIALTSLAGVKPTPGMTAAVSDHVKSTTKAAADALAILKPLPRDAAAVGAALGRLEAAMARVLEPAPQPAQTAPAPNAQTQNAQPQNAQTQNAPVAQATPAKPGQTPAETAATATQPGEPQTLQQAPLLKSTSSVIIRRGDTLWQISRRVYGAGVRYTTIYVANEDQIVDPDRILPGQVFGVPDKAMPDEESQELHRRHMRQAP